MDRKVDQVGYKAMTIKRPKTKQIKVGRVKIGGSAPISIQSMTKTDTRNINMTVAQIKGLEKAGCQIIRVAIKDTQAANAIKNIKSKIDIPLVADIHFDYRLALLAIQSGADKIRINPGNMTNRHEVETVVQAAKQRGIPIRIGLNSGSVMKQPGKSVADAMVLSALNYIKLFERLKFNDIIISLKASDVVTTVEAYKKIAARCNYPLHLGVTAAGLPDEGKLRSAIGIGSLLLNGIGDTVRVSLTADPVLEVLAARQILEAIGLASFGPQIISCPTCGRCQVDLVRIVGELKDKIYRGNPRGCPDVGAPRRVAPTQSLITGQGKALPLQRPIKIAVMGCEVNGPGEAKDADIGIAAGKNAGMLFRKGKPVRKVVEKDFVKVLLQEVDNIC